MEFAFPQPAEQVPVGLMTPTKPTIWQGSDEALSFGPLCLQFGSGQQV
jgi:hypothetical protein